MQDVLVVGAGIVGASVARHCARLGASVTLVDRGAPASGATGDSFAWVSAHGEGPASAAALRRCGPADYRRLEAELPGVRVHWAGSLSWWGGPPPVTEGIDVEQGQVVISAAAVAEREPRLREPPAHAVWTPGDGAVDPVAVTAALVQDARDHGAQVVLDTVVAALRVEGERVVGALTAAGPLLARTVVLAVGVAVPELLAPLGVHVPVAASPAVLVRLTGPGDLVRTVVSSPLVEFREGEDGQLLAALDHAGERSASELEATARRTLGDISSTVRDAEGVRAVSARVGLRPVPGDGAPVIGRVPGVPGAYVAVMHSGVTLAATVGRLVADELVHGADAPELAGLRPDRFTR